jgi:hypothetical protein
MGSLWSFDIYNVLRVRPTMTQHVSLAGQLRLGRAPAARDLRRVSLDRRLNETLAVH